MTNSWVANFSKEVRFRQFLKEKRQQLPSCRYSGCTDSLNYLLATATGTFDGPNHRLFTWSTTTSLQYHTYFNNFNLSDNHWLKSGQDSRTPGEFEFCSLRTCHAPKELMTVLLFLGPGLSVCFPFLYHSGPRMAFQLYLQTTLFNKIQIKTALFPRKCHFTSAKMCALVEEAGGAHSLNSECQTSMPLPRAQRATHNPAPNRGLWERGW